MTEFRTFKSGEILSDTERAKLSPEDRKRYDLEQKIRSLMKLADNSGATEDERAQATRTIAKLIIKYQIDLSILREEANGATGPVEIGTFTISLSNRYGLGGVRASAMSRMIQPLGGKLIWWHNSSEPTGLPTICRIWMPEDIEDFAKTLIASLTLQVETSMKVASARYRRELQDNCVPRNEQASMLARFRKGYLLSWGDTVGYRIRQGRQDARQEAQRETGKEIALLDTSALSQAALDAWNEEQGTKTCTARPVLVSETGKTAGRKDGMRAQLGINEVGGTKRTSLAS